MISGAGKTGDTGKDDGDEMVITPAGPMRKRDVRPVGPDEMVIRNEDGTYQVIKKPTGVEKPDPKKSDR